MTKVSNLLFRSTGPMGRRLAPLAAILALLLSLSSAWAQGGAPTLAMGQQVSTMPNNEVTIPITFTSNGQDISAMAFSVDYDENWLTFDDSDSNGDGIPDAFTLNLPAGFLSSVSFDGSDTDGELDIAIFNFSPSPPSLPDGTLASITLAAGNPSSTTEAAVAFSSAPAASFSDTNSQSVSGTTDDGSVLINISTPTPTASPTSPPTATPTATPTSLPGDNELVATCNSADIYPGDTVTADLTASGTNVYGVQASCAVDPTIVEAQSGAFGNFFDSPYLVGANQADGAAGTWIGAISQQNPNPPVSGSGILATLTYQALTPGSTSLTCEPLFSDRNGFEMSSSASPCTITVLEYGSISGTVSYQGRLAHANIEIVATGPVTNSDLTDSSGDFEIGQLRGGDYQVKADASSYLPACTMSDVAVSSGNTTTLPLTTLRGGDVNDDIYDTLLIDIGDATRLTASFGLPASADLQADINADGTINIQDLTILGGNYELSGCQDWPTS